MNNFLESFRVYDCFKSKKRYGRKNDGGYVIIDGLSYDLFLSGGIGNDLYFEKDFLFKNPGIESHFFDISDIHDEGLPKNTYIHKQCISGVNWLEGGYTNLIDYLNKHKDVFIKMDIEGGERCWVPVLDSSVKNIKQMVIEFHGIENSYPLVSFLNQTHILVHFHGNNFGGVTQWHGITVPNIFECTFLRKKEIELYHVNFNKLPDEEEDLPNCPEIDDIDLNFEPFVSF